MSIVHSEISGRPGAPSLPLLVGSPSRVVAWREGHAVTAATFLAHVRQVAASLPEADSAVNLCEDRYAFLVAFAALVLRGQTNLLPPSRAPHAVDEVMRRTEHLEWRATSSATPVLGSVERRAVQRLWF